MYPRVLIIYKNRVSERDSSGASVGRWFSDWPHERLAHIYTGGFLGGVNYCGNEYKLGGHDRNFGKLFDRLKRSSLSSSAYAGFRGEQPQALKFPSECWRKATRFLSRAMVQSGIWEAVFVPKPSPELIAWVNAFKPEVIYSQVPDLSLMQLTLDLQRLLHLPVCLQMSDDFPGTIYRGSFASWLIRPLVTTTFSRLVYRADKCLGTGEAMRREYYKRYGKQFEPVYICEDFNRFRLAQPFDLGSPGWTKIVYSGGLGHDRWRSLADLLDVVEKLNGAGSRIKVFVYGIIPEEARADLTNRECLEIGKPLLDAEVPSRFKGADVLFLPEGFSERAKANAKLSISTKSHLYMMSLRPILVYGPKGIGVVEYAKKEGWGLVVEDRNLNTLAGAVKQIINDQKLRETLENRGNDVAVHNHEASIVRRAFLQHIQSAARMVGWQGRVKN